MAYASADPTGYRVILQPSRRECGRFLPIRLDLGSYPQSSNGMLYSAGNPTNESRLSAQWLRRGDSPCQVRKSSKTLRSLSCSITGSGPWTPPPDPEGTFAGHLGQEDADPSDEGIPEPRAGGSKEELRFGGTRTRVALLHGHPPPAQRRPSPEPLKAAINGAWPAVSSATGRSTASRRTLR